MSLQHVYHFNFPCIVHRPIVSRVLPVGVFVETQEATGMRVIGQFRDLGDPNRFVWLRGQRRAAPLVSSPHPLAPSAA
jgi:hypothetical protein